jgi:hypothetical protein
VQPVGALQPNQVALHEAQLNFALLRPLGIGHVPELAQIPARYGLSAPRHALVDALLSSARFNFVLHPSNRMAMGANGRWDALRNWRDLAAHPDIRLWVTGSVPLVNKRIFRDAFGQKSGAGLVLSL